MRSLPKRAARLQRERQVREAQPLGDLPLVVLTHGIPGGATSGATAQQAAELEQTWQKLQAQQAALSRRVELVRPEHSGHNIALDQPYLVLDAIHKLLTQK